MSLNGDIKVWNGTEWIQTGEVDAIPDSGLLHEWPISAGSGSTLTDAEGSADISLNGGFSWDDATENWWDGWSVLFNGSDAFGVVDSNRTDPGDSGTVVLTVRPRSTSGEQFWFAHPESGQRLFILIEDGDWRVRIGDESRQTFASASADLTVRVGVRWDSGSYAAYLNGVEEFSGTYSGTMSLTQREWAFGAFNDSGSLLADGYIDYPRIAGEAWSGQEFADEHDAQPWS